MTADEIAKLETPLTDAAAIGFARILIDHEKQTTTELTEATFARSLEQDRAALMEALEQAVQRSIREPNEQFAYHRCNQCNGAWYGPKEGRSNPERPNHRLDCVVPEWVETLAAVKERCNGNRS